MRSEVRETLIDKHDRLCRYYNDTDDDSILEEIAVLEYVLFHDPDHVSTEPLEIETYAQEQDQ